MKLWVNFRPGGQFRKGLHTLSFRVFAIACRLSLDRRASHSVENAEKRQWIWRGQSRKKTKNKNFMSLFESMECFWINSTNHKAKMVTAVEGRHCKTKQLGKL